MWQVKSRQERVQLHKTQVSFVMRDEQHEWGVLLIWEQSFYFWTVVTNYGIISLREGYYCHICTLFRLYLVFCQHLHDKSISKGYNEAVNVHSAAKTAAISHWKRLEIEAEINENSLRFWHLYTGIQKVCKHCRGRTCLCCRFVQNTEQWIVCAVLQESCRVAFKTQTFWLSKLSEPLEIPAGVPEVISEDQVRGLNDQNCLEEPGFHETKRLMPSPSSHVFTLCCWSSSGPLLAQVTNWSLELPVSVLHMGRIHVALQLCQSLTCVMNSLPRNIPSDWSPVSH